MSRYENGLVDLTRMIWSNIPSLWLKKHIDITWDTVVSRYQN